MEKMVNVKEFKLRATRFVNGKREIVVTKFGKPIALVTPISSRSPEALMLSIGGLFKEAGISRKDAESAMGKIRGRLYGSSRRS